MSTTEAHLVLQYPDYTAGKVRLLAITQDRKALLAFKEAVIEEAQLNLLGCDDSVLRIDYQLELEKLRKLLDHLIPNNGSQLNLEDSEGSNNGHQD